MEGIKHISEYISNNEVPEILFWVGCAGAYDARAQKVSKAFAQVMNLAGVRFAILGDDEKCTGDPARRAGNEFLFQILALQNIETFKQFNITQVVTTCPHCFNTLKNDYPELGLRLDVLHHTTYINQLIKAGRLQVKEQKRDEVTFHDSCYLGRANGIYEDPREVLNHFQISIKEMNRAKATGLCCGAGGGQMFKEDEPGTKRINNERIEEAMSTGVKKIITNCPFCLTMMTDGVKAKDKQAEVMVYDLSEMIIQ